MTEETLKTCLGLLADAYPSRFKGKDAGMIFKQWFLMYGEEDDRVFVQTIRNALNSSKFCPSFVEMNNYIKRAKMQELDTPIAALPCSTTSIDRDLIEWAMIEGGYTEEVAHEVAFYEADEHL